MSIQSIGGLGIGGLGGYTYPAASRPSTAQQPPAASPSGAGQGAASGGSGAAQDFLNYMKETPAQRMEDAWLAAHHLTRKQLEAMPLQQREALEKQMAEDLKQKVTQAALTKANVKGGILA